MYNDQGNIATIRLPSNATGTEDHWEVFTIDGSNGEITLVNALTDTRPDIISGRIETRAQKNNISQKPISNMRGKTINSGTMFYKWDFGDGNTSTDESPTHIYQNSGNYTVKLESSDGANYSIMSYPDLITVVDNMPPVVTALAPDTVAVGLRAMVSIDLDTLFSDPDDDELSYSASTSNVYVAQAKLTDNMLEITGIWPNETDLVIDVDDSRVDGKISLTIKVIVAGGLLGLDQNNIGLPESFELWEAFPNPFNPTTTLRFDLPEVSDITLTIYNMLGQKVKTFNMQSTPAGYHSVTWNATNDLGAQVGAGVYLYLSLIHI